MAKYIGERDFMLEVVRGNIPGWYALNKFGRNPDIDNGTEDVWDAGGTWAAPTVARIHNVVSTNANDTLAGSGAQQVRLIGLDANYNEASETVALAGLTPVPTVRSYVGIFRARVLAGNINVGNITFTAETDATVTAQITAAYGQTLMAIWQVPAGKNFYMVSYYLNGNSVTAARYDVVLWAKPFGEVWQVKHTHNVNSGVDLSHEFQPPYKFTEKTLIKITLTSSANNQDVSAGFDGIYGNQLNLLRG